MSVPLLQQYGTKDEEVECDSIEKRVVLRAKRRMTPVTTATNPEVSYQFNGEGSETMMQVSDEDDEQNLGLVKMLPVEIWMEIIDWLQEPKDWLKLYYTCSYFRNLMDENKVVFLLPTVIQISIDHQKTWDFQDADVNLSRKDMRSCRLVCKSWNRSINNFASHYPSIKQLDTAYNNDKIGKVTSQLAHKFHRMSATLPIVLRIEETDKMKEILEYMETHKRSRPSPFFSRHLVIYGLPAVSQDDLKMELLTFLKSVGPSIWHFAVYPKRPLSFESSSRKEMNEWWGTMIECLNCLANLITLLIDGQDFRFTRHSPDINEIPHLPHLRVFQPTFFIPDTILQGFLAKNGHMKICNLRFYNGDNSRRTILNTTILNSIDLGKISEFSLEVDFHQDSYERKLLPYFQLPINKLVLTDAVICLEKLGKYLKDIEGSLTYLYVHEVRGPLCKTADLQIGRFVNDLPKLRHAELCVGQWKNSDYFNDGYFKVDCHDGNVEREFKVFEFRHGVSIRYDSMDVILRFCCYCD